MPNVAVVYASSYGQTAAIASRLAAELRAQGFEASAHDVERLPSGFPVSCFDALVLGGSVRGAKFPKRLRGFIRDNRALLARVPSAFFSVSLAMARKDERARDEIRTLTDHFPITQGWKPQLTSCFAGALPYRRYNFFLRFVMKRISKAAGGDTDTSKNYVYTDWGQVTRLARALVEKVRPARPLQASAPLRRPAPSALGAH